ncbi:MAG: hypothetical protein K2X60_12380 [Xanthobacteraceae bacterium]|nr:hypothetical protein [Xanthobacteraceae bacterium]
MRHVSSLGRLRSAIFLPGPAALIFLGLLLSVIKPGIALGDESKANDDGDKSEPAKAASQWPNIYLDMRTNFVTVPANTLSIGFGSFLPPASLASLSSVSARGVALDLPLTIDLTDRVSVFGGVTASSASTDISSWSPLTVESWNIGLQADVIQQNGGRLPTVTVLSTLTKSAIDGPLATTSVSTVLEMNYALNEDETKGLLAGTQYTNISVDSGLASVGPAWIGYAGAYYQWSNNWKLTGRAGVQSFAGGSTNALAPFLPLDRSLISLNSFTQPILRADLDKMDDNDNRLFGLTATVSWTPKPAFQFIIRTPLYLVRN